MIAEGTWKTNACADEIARERRVCAKVCGAMEIFVFCSDGSDGRLRIRVCRQRRKEKQRRVRCTWLAITVRKADNKSGAS